MIPGKLTHRYNEGYNVRWFVIFLVGIAKPKVTVREYRYVRAEGIV